MSNCPAKYVHFILTLNFPIILLLSLDIKLQQHPVLCKCRGNTGSPVNLQLMYPSITSDILIFTTLLIMPAILMVLVYLYNIPSYGNTLNKW